MAIKSSTTGTTYQNKSYPKLMLSTEKDFVVLFEVPSVGTVVHTTVKAYPLGYHSNSWVNRGFVDYNGTITLENE